MLLLRSIRLSLCFFYSLTDKKFASDKPTEFIGLDNYSMMLSMEFYEVPPQKDDAGKVKLDKNGNTLYEDPMDILPMDPVAYWEMYTFNIFGKRYTLAATDPEFLISIKDTVIFSVLAVALELIIGMAFALTLNSHFKGRGVMRNGVADTVGNSDSCKYQNVGVDVQFSRLWTV